MVVPISDAVHLRLDRRRYLAFWPLAARVQSHALDEALAAGASPDSSADLSSHARMLLRRSARRRLASQLRDVLRCAAQPRSVWNPSLLVPHTAILVNHDEIAGLARWLEDTEPVDVRGVAQLRLLLCRGDSPLYSPADSDQLEEVLEQIGQALVPFHAMAI